MAQLTSRTQQYASTHFVDSAGAVLFQYPQNPSSRRVILIHHVQNDQYLLAKGRRNVGESRAASAVREAAEETGYACELLPITLQTRAPPAIEADTHTPDEVRTFEGVTEPFMFTLRIVNEDRLKLIWWFIAAVTEAERDALEGHAEEGLEVVVLGCGEAMEKLTYQQDREVVQRAVELVELTYKTAQGSSATRVSEWRR